MGIQFRMLGPLEVHRDGVPVQPTSAKQRLVLAVLLVHANEVVGVGALVEALWRDWPPATATGALQNYISQLRKAIEPDLPEGEGPQLLLTVDPGYLLAAGSEDVDAATFERLVAVGRAALREERPAEGAELLREALGLWRGPALADVADEEPVRNEAMRLDELRVLATEERVAADIALGHHRELVAELDGLVSVHALRERLWAQLMLCLYRVGRQADALAAFQRLRLRLADELGLDPSAELVRLEHDILAQAPGLDWTEPVARSARQEAQNGSNLPVDREPRLFVGRAAEMDELHHWWSAGASGARVSLVMGAPGVGKTQLVTAFAREIESEGAQVLYGRAVEGGGSSYEPVLGALRQLVLTAPDAVVDAFPEAATGALTRLVPEMAGRRPDVAAKAFAWGEVDRSWLLGAVADCLAGPDDSPTLMVLDDLQWADRPALLLLSRLAEPGRSVRILGTYRPAGSAPTTPTLLADFLAQLGRDDRPAHRVLLGGLSGDDVGDLVTALAGAELSVDGRRFAADLHRRTDGHPFFVREMLRHLDDSGSLSAAEGRWTTSSGLAEPGIPEGVLDVVGQRLAQLRAASRDVLRAAAVIGPEFDVDLLAAVVGQEPMQVLTAMEEAHASGFVQEDPTQVDRYGFIHVLVQEVLLAELSRSRRARLEWRTGEALEALGDDQLEGRAGELARHFAHGAAVGRADKVVEWSLRAGAAAMERVAYEEAINYYEQSLEALGRAKGAMDAGRTDLLIALGRAANRAGDAERWRASCLEGAALARAAGDADRLAQAAISLLGSLAQGQAEEPVVVLMEEAIDALGASPPTPTRQALLAELLARLGGYLTNTRPDRSAELADAALATARRAGEKRSLALALVYSTQTHALDRGEHHARLHEAVGLAEEARDPEVVLAANSGLMAGALLWGDRDEFDRRLADYARVARETGAPTPLVLSAIDHAGATALDGRYDDAREEFRGALRRSESLGDPNLRRYITAGMIPVNRELGQLGRWAQVFRDDAADGQVIPFRQAGLVRVLCETGELDEATDRLESLLAEPEALLSGFLRRYCLALLAEAAAILGNTDAAARLSEWLGDELRSGLCVIIGPNACFGPSAATSACCRSRWAGRPRRWSTTKPPSTCTTACGLRAGRPAAATTWPVLSGPAAGPATPSGRHSWWTRRFGRPAGSGCAGSSRSSSSRRRPMFGTHRSGYTRRPHSPEPGRGAAMTSFGYTLSSEERSPSELVASARQAEEAGFDFLSISDHYHPWVSAQGHSPFVWAVLGSIAAVTERVRVGVGVTCPTIRIHPAVIAQASATTALLFEGRFFLGVGTGEALNEHILGHRWPHPAVRRAMLEEAVEIIRALWSGDTFDHRGTFYEVENAKLFDPPVEAPPVIVSGFGEDAVRMAARLGDGYWGHAPDREMTDLYRKSGGTGPHFAQLNLCWAENAATARKVVHEVWPNGAIPGQLSEDLSTWTHFEQAAQLVSEEDATASVPCGPDPGPVVQSVRAFLAAGYDHLYFHQIGPDQEGFLRFWTDELSPALDGLDGGGRAT